MSKSIFISCVHEDSHRINNIKKWASDGLLGENIVITHETEDKRHEGDDAIKKHIESKIRGAACLFILIGNDTHNHDWIRIEVELANSFHKEIICVSVPNTTGAVPPILAHQKIISFNPELIKKYIK